MPARLREEWAVFLAVKDDEEEMAIEKARAEAKVAARAKS